MTPLIKNKLKEYATKNNYNIRSEQLLYTLSDKFSMQVSKYGSMYCPCQNARNEDTICPCKHMREKGACRCGLYTRGTKR